MPTAGQYSSRRCWNSWSCKPTSQTYVSWSAMQSSSDTLLPASCRWRRGFCNCFGRCPIIGLPRRKVSPGRKFTGKNSPRPAAARAGRIFAGELSAGRDFSAERSYNGKTFYEGHRPFLIKGRHHIRDYLSPGGFSSGKHFNMTPAL